jgi:uncharacterized HAD superfamily protein
MRDAPKDERLTAMAALLEREGIAYEGVAVAGAHDDVAVVRTRDVDADRLAAIAKRIRALGFRYVTIDLETVAGGAA